MVRVKYHNYICDLDCGNQIFEYKLHLSYILMHIFSSERNVYLLFKTLKYSLHYHKDFCIISTYIAKHYMICYA